MTCYLFTWEVDDPCNTVVKGSLLLCFENFKEGMSIEEKFGQYVKENFYSDELDKLIENLLASVILGPVEDFPIGLLLQMEEGRFDMFEWEELETLISNLEDKEVTELLTGEYNIDHGYCGTATYKGKLVQLNEVISIDHTIFI